MRSLSKVIKFPNWVESSPRVIFYPVKWGEPEPPTSEENLPEEEAGEGGGREITLPEESSFPEEGYSEGEALSATAATVLSPEEVAQQIRAEALVKAEEEKARLLAEARLEIERMREAAQKEAERILAVAREEAETIRAEARRAGWEEGRQEGQAHGFEEGQRQTAEILGRVQQILEEVSEARTRLLIESEAEILKLVVAFAEKIIRRELRLDREAILRTLREAIGMLNDGRRFLLRLSPEDAGLVREMKEKFRAYLPDSARLEVVADERIERGGCLIETEMGNVDARIETQIAALVEQLKEVSDDGQQG